MPPRTAARRYAAFLRGVSPMNLEMPALKACFEAAGFRDVKTVLSSGNVVFTASAAGEAALETAAEEAMSERLGRPFLTFVRTVDDLRRLLAGDPYRGFRVPAEAKRVVTFLRQPPPRLPRLPVEQAGARILAVSGRTAFCAYVPGPRGPVFMRLIERTFGQSVTTRTWDTVRKVAG